MLLCKIDVSIDVTVKLITPIAVTVKLAVTVKIAVTFADKLAVTFPVTV